jgi:HK97 family phage portal protein
MGLGQLFRSTEYTVKDTVTNQVQMFTVVDNLAPDFGGPFYRGGMSIPGAWRAAVLLSDLLGGVPWHAFRQFADRPEERLSPTPPLLDQPQYPDTRMTTFSSWGLDLIWHGNAIGVIAARNTSNWPTAALAVSAANVSVRRVTPFVSSPLPVGELEYSIGSLRLGSQDIIHIKGPCEPGAVRGMGVLEAHLATLDLSREQIRQARSLSQHGVPTGVLKVSNPDATIKDLQDAKAGWMAAQATRTVAALNASTEFQPLSWNPEEMQLVEARRFTLTDLELMFGLPVGWLGGMNSARQYSNIEQDAVNLLKFSLGGHLARFEQTLTLHMPRGTQARANLDAFLRPDTLSRYQAYAIALDKQFLDVDEVRELEHRAPLPEKPVEPNPFASDDIDDEEDPDGGQG